LAVSRWAVGQASLPAVCLSTPSAVSWWGGRLARLFIDNHTAVSWSFRPDPERREGAGKNLVLS